jgi:hypothetical protein
MAVGNTFLLFDMAIRNTFLMSDKGTCKPYILAQPYWMLTITGPEEEVRLHLAVCELNYL